jgi:hypothetical protein
VNINWIFYNNWKIIPLPAICLVLSGCGSFFPDSSASPMSSTSQLTHQGTVASFDCGDEIISIGSSGYGYTEFIDVFGKKRNEQTSMLDIVLDNHPETLRSYLAYAELTIYFYEYKIQVLRLGRDLQNPFTEVSTEIMDAQFSIKRYTYCSFY